MLKCLFNFIFFVAIVGVNICKSQENNKHFVLKCKFEYLPDNAKAYLLTEQSDTLEVVSSKNAEFIFEGTLQSSGQFLFIGFDPYVSINPTQPIFVVNKEIIVEGVAEERNITVMGSSPHADYLSFLRIIRPLEKQYIRRRNILAEFQKDNLFDSIGMGSDLTKKEEFDSLMFDVNSSRSEYITAKKEWILAHKSSLITPYLLNRSIDELGLQFSNNAFEKLNKDVQESYYGKQLFTNLKYAATYDKFEKGALMPAIVVSDRNGKMQDIYNLVRQNKLTLIDCWASWCGPCRKEIPNLKTIYNKYKERGLDVIGISLDKQADKWIKAIEEDKSTWNHFVIVPEYPFEKAFNIETVPTYILLDASGRMIAFDRVNPNLKSFGGKLHGDLLSKTIESELKRISQ